MKTYSSLKFCTNSICFLLTNEINGVDSTAGTSYYYRYGVLNSECVKLYQVFFLFLSFFFSFLSNVCLCVCLCLYVCVFVPLRTWKCDQLLFFFVVCCMCVYVYVYICVCVGRSVSALTFFNVHYLKYVFTRTGMQNETQTNLTLQSIKPGFHTTGCNLFSLALLPIFMLHPGTRSCGVLLANKAKLIYRLRCEILKWAHERASRT